MHRNELLKSIIQSHPKKSENPISLDSWAINVFTNREIASRVPKETYKRYISSVNSLKPFEPDLADVIANAMKDWAVSRGATHFTHWFQPIHISSAEKHEAFITPQDHGGHILVLLDSIYFKY